MVDLWLRLSLLFIRHAGSCLKAHNLWISKRPWPRDTDFSVSRTRAVLQFLCVSQSPVSVRVARRSSLSQWQSAIGITPSSHLISTSPRPSALPRRTHHIYCYWWWWWSDAVGSTWMWQKQAKKTTATANRLSRISLDRRHILMMPTILFILKRRGSFSFIRYQ